ncbi:MAG TPA: serine/threonine-protein kinase [Candidatus Xenobia bacterium]|jgi:predicted Ser/Thr protein kinase
MRWAVVLLVVLMGTPVLADLSHRVHIDSWPRGAELYEAHAFEQASQRQFQDHEKRSLGKTPGEAELVPGVMHYVLYLPGHDPADVTIDPDKPVPVSLTLHGTTLAIRIQDHLKYDPLTWSMLALLLVAGGAAGYVRTHREKPSYPQATLVNHTIDGYRVSGMLGEGGYSIVYKADKADTTGPVAIKVLKRDHLERQDTEILNRFHRETMVQLIHPNIVTLLGCGEYLLRPYIVLEYVEGWTLRELMQPRMDLTAALQLLMQIGEGLAFAHQRGYVHRDLKPENIMITRAGRAKIMDFGIAKHINKPGATQSATAMGTPRYMSPEHVDSKTTDARSDLYSIGVMLFEMVTGEVPFHGEQMLELIGGHLFATPPLVTDVDPQLPMALADIIDRMLAKKPADRYQSMAEVMEALRHLAETLQLPIDQPFEVPIRLT